jgi:hypothetical protein
MVEPPRPDASRHSSSFGQRSSGVGRAPHRSWRIWNISGKWYPHAASYILMDAIGIGCRLDCPLTAFSRTGWTALDLGVLSGHPADPDLRKRTSAHWPDVLHATTDQKVGGSSPSERASQSPRRSATSRAQA